MEKFEKFPTEKEKGEDIKAQQLLEAEKGFIEKLSGKAKTVARVMALLTALAAGSGVWAKGEAGATEKRYKYTREELQQRFNRGEYSGDERMQRKIERMYKKAEEERKEIESYKKRASELADKMDIPFDPNKARIYLEGFVPTIINGQNVPLEFLTGEERQSVERARKIKQSPETESHTYMDPSDL